MRVEESLFDSSIAKSRRNFIGMYKSVSVYVVFKSNWVKVDCWVLVTSLAREYLGLLLKSETKGTRDWRKGKNGSSVEREGGEAHRIGRLFLGVLHPDAASFRRQQDEALQTIHGDGRITRVLKQQQNKTMTHDSPD